MTSLKRAWFLVVLVITCIAVAGCPGGGERLCTVTGKVVEGGQPAGSESGESGLSVEFFPLDDRGSVRTDVPSFSTFVKEDGSFVADGLEGKGIPAGKYRVAVNRTDLTDGAKRLAWEAKFGRDGSPFEHDVSGDQEITLDISQAPGE